MPPKKNKKSKNQDWDSDKGKMFNSSKKSLIY